MITSSAMRNGFTGGLIVDYPNSKKAKKYYLFLMAGYSEEIQREAKQVIMPTAKEGNGDSEDDSSDEDDEEDDDMEDGAAENEGDDDSDEDDGSDNERIDVKGKHRKDFKKMFEKKVAQSMGPSANGISKSHKKFGGRVKDRSWILNKKDRQRR